MNGSQIIVGFDQFCTPSLFCVNLPPEMLQFRLTLSTDQIKLLATGIRLRESDNWIWRTTAEELWNSLSQWQKDLAVQLWVDGKLSGSSHENENDLDEVDPEIEDVDVDTDTDPEIIEDVVKFLAEIVA